MAKSNKVARSNQNLNVACCKCVCVRACVCVCVRVGVWFCLSWLDDESLVCEIQPGPQVWPVGQVDPGLMLRTPRGSLGRLYQTLLGSHGNRLPVSHSSRMSSSLPSSACMYTHTHVSSAYMYTHTCIICLHVHTHMYHLLVCSHTHVSSACMYTHTCIICLYVHTRARAGTAYTNTHRKCGSQGALRLDSWPGILQVAPVCVRARIRVCSSMRVCLRTCTHGHKEYLLPGGISGAVAWIALTQLT